MKIIMEKKLEINKNKVQQYWHGGTSDKLTYKKECVHDGTLSLVCYKKTIFTFSEKELTEAASETPY